jgi:hypothetical protein
MKILEFIVLYLEDGGVVTSLSTNVTIAKC